MKREGKFFRKEICFLLIIFLLIVNIIEINGKPITGEIVTGEATQSVSMSIRVIAPPTLSLLSPKNETYLTNISLLLDYSVVGEDNLWYSLDSGANITITSPISFNTSQGSHSLYLYANNSDGISTANVDFNINSTRFIILYTEYNGTKKGSSTDFVNHTYESIQNLSDIVLENTEYGEIDFNEVINLTDDEDVTDNLLDLDTYTNISYNRIELNSTALPNFNKSATLYIYNLTFLDPRILRNGEVCPSTICTLNNYSGGILSFNVTGFAIYSSDETPSEPTLAPSGGGGGGGGRAKKIEEFFIVDKEIIKIQLKEGGKLDIPLTITSKYNYFLDFNIESNLQDIISFSETEFRIQKGKSKEIQLSFDAKEGIELGVYSGKIIVKTKEKIIEIPVTIEIESKRVIFDVILDIPLKYKEIFAGENVLLQLTIFNLGDIKETDVIVEYLIKDFEGNMIFSGEEKIKVLNQASFSKIIKISEYTKPDDYVAIARIRYEESVGTSSNIFRVKPPILLESQPIDKRILWLIIILLIILILIIILIIRRRHKKLKKSVTLYKREVKDKSKKIRKLHKADIRKNKKSDGMKGKMSTLERAYSEGYIRRSSYEKVKNRIKNLFRN